MTSQDNRELARRHVTEVWNERNVDAIDEMYGPDYVGHWFETGGGDADRAALKEFIHGMHEAFTDLELTIEFVHADDEYVTTGVTATGTNDGGLMGMPSTDETLRDVPAHITNRIEDGRIVEGWATWDALGMMQSLGVLPEDLSQAAPSADD